MQQRRTKHFQISLLSVTGVSTLFLAWMGLFGMKLAQTHFNGVLEAVLAVMMLTAVSFLAFSFMPYFHGDKRWYAISALLTAVFFMGTGMLWAVPLNGVVIG